jgi:hypothetical protein
MHQLLRILARAAVIAVIASLFPARLHASDLWLDGSYAKPLGWNVGAFLFFDPDDVQNRNGGHRIIVGGNVGSNGMQAWGGKPLDLPGGGNNGALDLRAVITRTWDNPRGASPNSTYVGGEVGWLGLVGFFGASRLSVGYAKRVSGPSPGDGHLLTWGVGYEIPAFW